MTLPAIECCDDVLVQLDDDSHFNSTVSYDILKRMRTKKLWMAAADVTADVREVGLTVCPRLLFVASDVWPRC